MYETLITHYKCPLYFGEQMSKDIGISNVEFQKLWKATDEKRTIGQMTFEEIIEEILRVNNRYSDALLQKIVTKRVATKKLCFEYLNPELLATLEKLKEKNIQLAIISNCFSEEAPVIRESVLSQYFNTMLLSFEQGIRKPSSEIFLRCTKQLGVDPKECLYVGDGGSHELFGAQKVGMKALQAGWYLRDSGQLSQCRQEEFPLLEQPSDVLLHLE